MVLLRSAVVLLVALVLPRSQSLGSPPLGEEPIVLEVGAGSWLRHETPIRWEIPSKLKMPERLGPADFFLAEVPSGREVPAFQIDPGPPRAIVWILEADLPPGGKRRYRLTQRAATRDAGTPAVSAVRSSSEGPARIRVEAHGKPVFVYNVGEVPPPINVEPLYARSGYLHPVYTPAGRILTNDSPPNHKHHHGIWMPWSQTDFEGHPINFWEQNRLEGKVECVGAEDVSGPVFGGVRAAHRFLDLKSAGGPKPVLDETWDVKVYAFAPQYFLVDFTSVQKCAGSSPLRFRQHRYGGFGFRGSADWEGPAGCEFITSEGKTRKDGHGTSAWWCEVFGKVGGEVAGISFLCHPSNFRAPQNMRIHEAEPFFNYAPCQDGDFELAPGSSFISRYRLVLHDGALSVQELQRLWRDYAKPPSVALVEGDGPQ